MLLALTLSLPLAGPLPTQEADDRPHVVFLTGDEEYRSEESMPMLAALLEEHYGCRTTVLYALDEQGYIAPNHLTNIAGLEALEGADLMVMFTRFRALPDDQLQHILDYAASGRPMVGFRTATHPFLYPKDDARRKHNDGFAIEYFGQRWITHHSHRSTTEVEPAREAKGHPVLRGVGAFDAPSWLYHVDGGGDALPADAQVVAHGRSLNSGHGEARAARFPLTQPVAWVRERADGQRVFFTTLGHPFDFMREDMRTLSLNGILWALGREADIPSGGCEPLMPTPFTPTKAAYGGAVPGRRPAPLPEQWEPRQGARIAFVGNTMAERMSFYGGFEAMLHAVFPEHGLTVRNLGWSADTPSFQPRPAAFGSMAEHLARLESDTVFAFFGFNESFDGEEGLPAFRRELEDFVREVRARRLADGTAPEIVLVSPFAPEFHGGRWPSSQPLIAQIRPYVETMREVARRCQVRFLDVFSNDARVTEDVVPEPWNRRTINGIHLSAQGDMAVATDLMLLLTGDAPFPDERFSAIKDEVQRKSRAWWYRHRAVNGYYIYGGRKDPFGTVSFPGEMDNLDRLTAMHDARIHALATAEDIDAVPAVDPTALPPLPTIPTNYTKDIRILTPAEAEAAMDTADGYVAEVFASEVDFPELENPVSMTFDGKGRLWVSVMPTYPQVMPGEEPRGKLLILEDTTGDGRADECIVFADGLYLPGGFELGDGGAYVAQQPYLMFLEDTDGDDRADRREVVLQGFGTEDSHHSISAFTWGPGGGLYMQEGTFHHTQVETPYGPVRVKDGAVFRWEPHTGRFRVHTPFGFWNPWGHVFDDWGQDYVGDASDGNNYLAAPMATDKEYERYRRGLESFTTARVRPTGGAELVTGHGFPAAVQGHYLVSNCIGFQGIRAHALAPDGSGVAATAHWDLLSSRDPNFRPIDLQFGPDGALWFVDWFNPLIGHMQHSLRDPNRDHRHGRVWRVRYVGDEPVPARSPEATAYATQDLTRLDAAGLTPLLADQDARLRYRVRREFRRCAADAIEAALSSQPPIHDLAALEHFWVRQQAGILRPEHVESMWQATDHRVRAAVVRAMNLEVGNPVFDGIRDGLLWQAAHDDAPQVRLEAVAMATRMPSRHAVEAVLTVAGRGSDRWLDYALEQALLFLKPQWTEALAKPWTFLDDKPDLAKGLLAQMSTAELLAAWRRPEVARAILLRPEIDPATRRAALADLGTAAVPVEAWLGALEEADALPAAHRSGLGDLVALFALEDLRTVADPLAALARDGRHPEVRLAAMHAWMRVVEEGQGRPIDPASPPDALWTEAAASPQLMLDALEGARLAGEAGATRRAAYLAFLIQAPHAWPGCPPEEQSLVGRRVRIELDRGPLTLAEVEVWSGGRNVAREGTASQDSTAWDGVAARAIDGRNDGGFGSGTQTHTAEGGAAPWWEVDLGADYPIESIRLWNRTDGSLGQRLDGYRLQVLDAAGRPVWEVADQPAPARDRVHELQADWRGAVRRGAIRALAAAGQLPGDPTLGATLQGVLEATPAADRGQDWFQEGLGLLARLGRGDAARALEVRVQELRLSGLPVSASLDAIRWRPGGAVELRVFNDTARWQAVGLVTAEVAAALRADEPMTRLAADARLTAGLEVYRMHCLSCHSPDGGGLVGPNMTDDRYLHLDSLADMRPLVEDGLLERGMTPFKDVLGGEQIDQVIAYMAALRGTVPASGKEGEGELVAPWETPAARLARLGHRLGAHTEAIAPGESAVILLNAPRKGSWFLSGLLQGGADWQMKVELEGS